MARNPLGGVHRPSALDSKVLRQDGTLVRTDPDGKAITFSKEQTLQPKGSMSPLGALCDRPTHQRAHRCGGKTHPSSYALRTAVLHGSLAALRPNRTGPPTPPQRTQAVEALLIRRRFETDEHMDDIADAFTPLGGDVRARRVGQVRAAAGRSKKNRSHPRPSQRGSSPRRRPPSSLTRARRVHASSPVTPSRRT